MGNVPEKILGVEGGGTKTAWALAERDGQELRVVDQGKLPPSNFRLATPDRLRAIFAELPKQIDRAGIFLAGCGTAEDRQSLANLCAEIWPGAKIVTLADSFDAMTTDRPYRKKLPLEDVLEDFRVNTGTQFDPQVVCAFCRAFLKEIEGSKERRLLNLINRNYSNVERLSPMLSQMLSEFDGGGTQTASAAGH